MNRIKKKNRYLAYTLIMIIIPVVLIFLLSIFIKGGTMVFNTKELIIDFKTPTQIGDYISYYISILGIEITGVFSYILFLTSVKSNNLAEAINNQEKERDQHANRESAVIVYYDLISQITRLKMLYAKYILEKDVQLNRRIHINNEWLKNIANLRKVLNMEEIDELIEIYDRLECIEEVLTNDKQQEILIKELSEDTFITELLPYLWMNYNGEIPILLNNKVYNLMKKIYGVMDDKDKINGRIWERSIVVTDGNILEVSWKDNEDRIRYKFKYKDGELMKGKFIHLIEKSYKTIFDGYLKKGVLDEGIAIEFFPSGRIKYEGNMKAGKYEGEGKLYNDTDKHNIIFEGKWSKGKRVSGKLTSKNIRFVGEFKNNRPYTGEAQITNSIAIDGAYGFKGYIEKGEPINGEGYSVINIINNNDIEERNQEELEEYNSSQDEIDMETRREMKEQDIRDRYEQEIEDARIQGYEVMELIETQWHNGSKRIKPNDSLYKTYLVR